MKILLVDDDSVSREYIIRTLNRAAFQYSVDQSDTALLGQEFIEKNHYDIVLLDYYLPGTNGLEMLLHVKGKSQFEGTAVIMMSNSEDEDLAEHCLRCGAQDFLLKSEITPKRLYRAITNAQTRRELEYKLNDSLNRSKLLAETDQLTGLANRFLFNQELQKTLLKGDRTDQKVVVMFIDLDHFKYVNDSYGHNAGDDLLKIVVVRIKRVLRGMEMFARLGGDEFAIYFESSNPSIEACLVSQRILTSLQTAIEVDNHSDVMIGASIGITVQTSATENAANLLSQADVAMYRAKSLGRNRFCFFEAEMQMQSLERISIENGLRRALQKDEFELHYQPIFVTASGELWGFEALVRWRVDGTLFYPDKFIEIAEETRLIKPIGEWIMTAALTQLSVWREKYGLDLNIAINLSAVQLDDKQLTMKIKNLLQKLRLAPNNIEFEITETSLLENSKKNIQSIKELCRIGCRIALDDFGTGYSSISHLYAFPIQTVKLDRSIISGNLLSKRTAPLAAGLAKMIHMLQIETVAEGIEDIRNYQHCKDIGVNRLQGYFFSKPLTADDAQANILEKHMTLDLKLAEYNE